ncbi:DUF433 domain-containing protein [Synechocystis salina LEGE 00031]|uniref:DUF433 domain-containing protein n=2 Tax=Synechocystis TaxID=1142 RepID=A0ABR9VRA5_9SYNC|nr:DUF433 domain-containing protein [Synechocystis salina LEGE 00041]MBE9253885.1 DUF433 domain-containing protein [Synechocystis salina LEGE 00031]
MNMLGRHSHQNRDKSPSNVELSPQENAQFQRWAEGLVQDPAIMGGETVFPDSRLTVLRIASLVERGEHPAAILEDYPYLKPIDLKFAPIYCQSQTCDRAYQPL